MSVSIVSLASVLIYRYDCFYCNADPFATKLGFKVYHHKPECHVRKLGCCVQGQRHSNGSKCQCFVLVIPSDPQGI